MQVAISARSMIFVRLAFILALVAGSAYYIALSLRAPMIWDTPIMRYVNFLMDHGMEPYSQIADINMPGAYLAERWATWVFGQSDLGCRLYEFFEMAVLVAACIVVAGRRLWFGGAYAGGFFVLMHASEGPLLATERDELVMVLIVVAFAFLFESMRRGRPLLMAPFGAALGMAASVKPTVAPLEILLLAMAAVELSKRGRHWLPYAAWALGGTAAIAGVVLSFLMRHHAFGPMLVLLRIILPAYVDLNHPTMLEMARNLIPPTVLLILPFAIAAMIRIRPWREWEERALALGAAAGLLSYFAQGKGFVYHRYLFLIFVLLCAGKALAASMRSNERSARAIGATGVMATLLLALPYYIFLIPYAQRAGARINTLSVALQGDLTTLGGDKLQGQVQCFDVVGGCLNALYHLRLVQRTGLMGDLLFFSPTDGTAVRYARKLYWDDTANAPPEVIVLGNEWFQSKHRSFDKIDTWPEFANYLQKDYALALTRTFSPVGTGIGDSDAPAYRIYLLKERKLPAR